MKHGELIDLVIPKVSLDEFSPKTGENKDVIVLGFYVDDLEPAKDLSNFIETGAYETLDVEASPASNDEGHYMVFVEMKRNEEVFEKLNKIIHDVENLSGKLLWKVKPYYAEEDYKLSENTWKEFVIVEPDMYVDKKTFQERRVEAKEEEYKENLGNFLIDSLMSNVSLDKDTEKDTIQFTRGKRVFEFELVNFGQKDILEDISTEPIRSMLSDDLAFADAIGKSYAINNFSEGRFTITREDSNDVMLLRKI
tara:strand:- start:3552 stop:4307 length:756 start_codon:yes stop_codon:yes gene_type:complete